MKPNIPNLIRWLRRDDNRMPHGYFFTFYQRKNHKNISTILKELDSYYYEFTDNFWARYSTIKSSQKVTKRYILIANYRSEK